MPTLHTKENVELRKFDLPKLLLSIAEVIHVTGLSESAIYLKMKNGTFPRSLKSRGMRPMWKSEEVVAWIDSLGRWVPMSERDTAGKKEAPTVDQNREGEQTNDCEAARLEAGKIVAEGACDGKEGM